MNNKMKVYLRIEENNIFIKITIVTKANHLIVISLTSTNVPSNTQVIIHQILLCEKLSVMIRRFQGLKIILIIIREWND